MKAKAILANRRSLPNISQALVWADLPALEGELLLGHVLNRPRTSLFAHPETKIDHTNWQEFQSLVESRRVGEPIAYLLGYKEFFGMKLKVDSRVLIPRPETEALVLEVLKLKPSSVADIGTGSGAIALALAKHLPKAEVYATDISPDALELARENAKELGLQRRVTFLKGSLAEPLPGPVDLIAANLPYIRSSWIDTLEPQVRDFEPRVALDGGRDGMQLYNKLFNQAPEKLNPGGQILYELDGRILFWQPRRP